MSQSTKLIVDRDYLPDWYEDAVILEATVGSEAHGVTQGDDHDVMAVFVPPPEVEFGFQPIDTILYRTAWNRTGVGPKSNDQPRSQEGDIDYTAYSLRKYLKLALAGNPSVLVPLYVDESLVEYQNERGIDLRSLRTDIISSRVIDTFGGYMNEQKRRLLGQQGQKNVKRPELIEQFGYDTKYAFHMIRLGMQGVELAQSGSLTLPMSEAARASLMRIRQGECSLDEVISIAGILDITLKELKEFTPLPLEPNRERIEKFLVDTCLTQWNYIRC